MWSGQWAVLHIWNLRCQSHLWAVLQETSCACWPLCLVMLPTVHCAQLCESSLADSASYQVFLPSYCSYSKLTFSQSSILLGYGPLTFILSILMVFLIEGLGMLSH